MKKIRFDDSYMNAFGKSNRRGRMSNYSSELMAGGSLFPQPILQSVYIHNGFGRLICDKPAEEMLRAGFKIDGIDDATCKKVESKLEELDATKKMGDAIKWCRAFGGGLMVMGINDGGLLIEPVDEPGIEGIEFLRVYDRFEAYPSKRYDDPADSRYGNVELWQISPKTGITSYEVHESRVLIFDGESIPNDIRIANQGWGASVIQTCFIQLTRLDAAYKWAGLALERLQQAVHGIPNLSQQIDTPEGEIQVAKRVEVVDQVRNIMNTVVIDILETYEIKSLTLSGVKDVLDKNAEALASVSSLPVFILMGSLVGGLNTNGDASKDGWYAQISAWQNNLLKKPWSKLVEYALLEISEGSSDGGDWTIEFNPLANPSDKDQSAIDLAKEQAAYAKMQTLTGYATAGFMDQDEGREVIREDYDLIGDAPEPEPEPEPSPMLLNPGQKLVAPIPGQHNPALPAAAKKTPAKKTTVGKK